MKDDKAMFNIKDGENISLNDNGTTSGTLLDGERIKNLTATGNKSGIKAEKPNTSISSGLRKYWSQVIVGVSVAIIAALILRYI